jgi:hypothetical protein
MKEWQQPYLWQFIGGMIGYAILLVISLLVIGSEMVENTAVSILITLIPMLPLLYAIAAVVRNVRQQDELAQRIHLEAILITALITGGITFSYGLLEAASFVPSLPMTVVAPFMIIVWGVANNLISRHYDN